MFSCEDGPNTEAVHNGSEFFENIPNMPNFYIKNRALDDAQNVCRDSAVGIAIDYGLDDQWIGVRVPVGQEFLLLHFVQTGSGAQPASYAIGTGGSFPGDKAAGECS
jgi:hypothetical protein